MPCSECCGSGCTSSNDASSVSDVNKSPLLLILPLFLINIESAAALNPEWKVHGDAKYAYFADRVTWEEAKAACNAIVEEGDTAQLASIFSKGEHDFITETLTRDAESGGSTWLGCTSSADRFNWVGQYDLNGKPQSCHKLYNGGNNFEYWHTNEPVLFLLARLPTLATTKT